MHFQAKGNLFAIARVWLTPSIISAQTNGPFQYLTNCPAASYKYPQINRNRQRVNPAINRETPVAPRARYSNRVRGVVQSTMKPHQRRTEELRSLLEEYLVERNLFEEDAPWYIKESPLGGLGVFAKRDINVGEVVYRDAPVVLGPRAVLQSSVYCVVCCAGGEVKACSRGCGLPVCGNACESSKKHTLECKTILSWRKNRKVSRWDVKLVECLTPVRALFLSKNQKNLATLLQHHKGHGFEINTLKEELELEISQQDEDFMKFLCAVLDANAFEVTVTKGDNEASLRGLYPLASLANHQCVPNTTHVFDCDQNMLVVASIFIQKDTEIFHAYTRLLWGTLTRRYHLMRTKHFSCRCPRCLDPTEMGTNIMALLCKKCKGCVLPKSTFTKVLEWECTRCKEPVPEKQIGFTLSVLGAWLKPLDKETVDEMIVALKERFLKVVPGCNEIVLEMKYKLLWILGYREGYFWTGI